MSMQLLQMVSALVDSGNMTCAHTDDSQVGEDRELSSPVRPHKASPDSVMRPRQMADLWQDEVSEKIERVDQRGSSVGQTLDEDQRRSQRIAMNHERGHGREGRGDDSGG